MEGRGSLQDIKEECKRKKLIDFLENFNVRTVLTAHPQFYPGSVLGLLMIWNNS
jgi:phosphoenolpyruvate carboxylase